MDIFNELLVKGLEGDAISYMTRAWEKSKRFSVVRLAKVSDMDSSFNPTAVGAIRACEGGLGKREMGLLCGASSIRRRQAKVHELAISLGWSWLPGEPTSAGIGELGWMWGCDDQGPFERGVHLCVKLVYYDTMMMVGKEDPWIVALTGDAARVSQRGSIVTTCGAKEVDRRLPSQKGTGKVMNQSRSLYTPMLAGVRR